MSDESDELARVAEVLFVPPRVMAVSPDWSFPKAVSGKSASVTRDSKVEFESSIRAPHCGQNAKDSPVTVPVRFQPQAPHASLVGTLAVMSGGAPEAMGVPGSDLLIEVSKRASAP